MNKMPNKILASFAALVILNPANIYAMTKTETIYANLSQNGTVDRASVDVGLKSIKKGEVIDYTKLEEIKNISGQETFSRESEKVIWKSTGRDIYYQGLINDSLPIEVSIKYYLDDKEMTPKEMKGKKGIVRVEIDYRNNVYDNNSGMYTPFVVTTVMIMPEKNNSKFSVTNGKAVNTGTKSIIASVSAPGMYESTNISEFKSLNHTTISYKTKSFNISTIYIITTPKLLDSVDLSKIDEVSYLTSQVNTLQNGVNEIQSGSKKLEDGSTKITKNLETLNKGLEDALKGSNQLTEGLEQLVQGTSSISSLTTLVNSLYETYNNNNKTLNEISSGTTKEQLLSGITTATSEKQVLEEQLITVKSQILQLEQLMELDTIAEEQLVLLNQLYATSKQLQEEISKYNVGIEEAQTNLAKLPYTAATIQGANMVIESVLEGILGVTSMEFINDTTIASFNEKIEKMSGKIQELHSGSEKLTQGIEILHNGSSQLADGSKQVTKGSNELYKGIEKLNNQGIHKITEYGKIANHYTSTTKKLINLSKNYHGFSSDNVDETIFIYKVYTK